MANPPKQGVSNPSVHPLCQRWGLLMGRRHPGCAQGLACTETALCEDSRSYDCPKPWRAGQKARQPRRTCKVWIASPCIFNLPLPGTRNCNSRTTQRGSWGSSAINSCWSYLHSLWSWQTCARARTHTHTHTQGLTHVEGAIALPTLSQNLNASAALTDLRIDHWAWIFHLRPTAPDLTWAGTSFTYVVLLQWALEIKKKKASLGSFLQALNNQYASA